MKNLRSFAAGLALGLFFFSGANAQETPAPSPVTTELKALIKQVRDRMRTVRPSAESLAPEIAAFDALLAKYPEKNDDTAEVAIMKAMLYVQVLEDEETGRRLLTAIKTDFPGTKPAASVDQTLARLDQARDAKAKVAGLAGKPAPELHFKWASKAGLTKLSDLKGKVVVLDFWATWCGPCIGSFPQMREHVARYKDAAVAFVGVTSLQGFVANMGPRIDTKGDPQKEYSLMPEFMKAKEMTWDVAFSEEEVFNSDYGIQGIPYVAIIAPDGTVRFAGLHPGDPSGDIAGKIEAILKEFNLPAPAPKA